MASYDYWVLGTCSDMLKNLNFMARFGKCNAGSLEFSFWFRLGGPPPTNCGVVGI